MENNDLPEGWTTATIGAVTIDKVESGAPTEAFTYVDISSIDNDEKKIANPKRLSADEAPSRAKQHLEAGDVLVSMTRPNLNAVALTPEHLHGAIGTTGFDVLRANGVDPRWLFAAVRTTRFVAEMSEKVQGALYPAVKREDVRSFELPLPSLAEQRRIADRLDAIQSHTRKARETLAQLPRQIEEYRQSVLNAAFTGQLTADWREDHTDIEPADELLERILEERRKQWENDYRAKYDAKDKDLPNRWKTRYTEPDEINRDLPPLPDTWNWLRLQQLSTVYGGVTKNSSKSGDLIELPYLRVANVYADELRLGEVKTIKLKRSKRWKYLLQEGDFLVVEGNGSKKHIGRVAEWDGSIDPCVHQNHLIKVRIVSVVASRYVLSWMLSTHGRDFITSEAKTTSGLYTLSLTKVRNIPVPLPPADEQKEIVRRVHQRLDKIDEMAAKVEAAQAHLDHLDRSVLAKAFRGELVETEAARAEREGRDYESAEELLQRVREGEQLAMEME